MGRWSDGARERWGEGAMGRGSDGAMGRLGDWATRKITDYCPDDYRIPNTVPIAIGNRIQITEYRPDNIGNRLQT